MPQTTPKPTEGLHPDDVVTISLKRYQTDMIVSIGKLLIATKMLNDVSSSGWENIVELAQDPETIMSVVE